MIISVPSRYFVTNLHGGTLTINGVQIEKNCIAGPLPEFTVIETSGNQVSFWFGPSGMEWKAGSEGVTYSSQWKTLRRLPGWDAVALTGGQVWDLKIREQVRNELMGYRYGVHPPWKDFLKPGPHPNMPPGGPILLPQQIGALTNIPESHPPHFTNQQDELKYLNAQGLPQANAPSTQSTNPDQPPTKNPLASPITQTLPGQDVRPPGSDYAAVQFAHFAKEAKEFELLKKQRQLNV